jgi:DNA-nicking Smr family endonuclease
MMIGGGFKLSPAKQQQQPNGADMGDANNRRVVIGIRDVNSGEIECTFRFPRSHKLQRIYDALRALGRGGEDSFILKLDGRRTSLDDTPSSLSMSDHIELSCVPSVKVDVRNFWTREIERSFDMELMDTFRLIHPVCVKMMRGSAAFDFSFHGRRVKLNDTPSSLGMKSCEELTCVPVPVVTIVIKDMERPGIEQQRFVVRRCRKLSELYLKYREMKGKGSFFFMCNGRKLSLHETPDSLCMNDQVEVSCVSSSAVIIDIFNVETQEVEWTMILKSSDSFRRVYKACEENRPHYKGKARSSFFLEFRGSRIDYDTPNSLGTTSAHTVITYIPNPIVEIDLHNKYGEFVRTFRLKPHQPLRTIYNAYSKLSFRLMFKGSAVPPEATPDSLGMKDREELAWEQTVSIFIYNVESNVLEHMFHSISKTTCILDYTKAQRKDKTPFYLVTKYRKVINDTETPDTLYMNGQVDLFLFPSIVIRICNSETQEVTLTNLRRVCTFQDLVKEGMKYFDFTFNGVIVDLDETPLSLGLKNYAEFVYVPRLINISIRNRVSGDIEYCFYGSRTTTFRSIREETIEQRNGNSTFTFNFDGSFICDNSSPRSLMLEDNVEIFLEPYAVIDIRDSVTQEVSSFQLGATNRFRTLHDAYEEFDGSDGSSFDFYFNGDIIDLDKDTPKSLGMKYGQEMNDHEEVVVCPQVTDFGEECTCVNCRKRSAEAHILGLDETHETHDMEASEDEEKPTTIDIVFVDKSSSNEVTLRHAYDGKMKTLLSRYAATRGVPLKSFRFKYDNRMLFVSSSGSKSPYDLGMQERDVIYASRLGNDDAKPNIAEETTKKSCLSQGGSGAKKVKGKKKGKKKVPSQPTYSTMDEEERLRRVHSKMLSRVFDEANPRFKKIRQQINSLALEQTPPKSKSLSPRARAREPTAAGVSDIESFSLENKAIKSRFNIIAGEVSNLYKSTKPSKKMKTKPQEESITIDLHGYTKEAALDKLDASLPSWIDAAMHGDYPFVIPVTIICGAGGQVLSEVVEKWIRENERVAKARKTMFN